MAAFLVPVLAALAVFSLADAASAVTTPPPPGITATASAVDCQGNWQLIFNSTSDQDWNVNWFISGPPLSFYAGVKVLPAHGSVSFDLDTVPAGQSLTVTPQVYVPDATGVGQNGALLPNVTVSRPSTCAALCAPVLLTVNGSGQLTGSPEMNAITDRVKALALGAGQKVLVVPVSYPAVPWWEYASVQRDISLRPPSVTLNIDFTGGLEKSEGAGMDSLTQAIQNVRRTCPGRPLLLAGYSQGADVVSRVVNGMTSAESNHVSVGLLGNPSFLPGLARDQGTYSPLLPGIRVAQGQPSFPITNSVGNRTIDACLGSDLICNFYPSLGFGPLLAGLGGAHLAYVTSKETSVVGNFLWSMRNN